MNLVFLNAALLAGLAAVAVPPIIHLLNRKRYVTLPWGAMQFLLASRQTRRRILLEEILLMAVRMLVLALLALGLAAPLLQGRYAAIIGGTTARDVAIVLDGSASAAFTWDGTTADAKARQWAESFAEQLRPGDGVAVIQARAKPLAAIAEPSADRDRLRAALRALPAGRGAADWPAAVQVAVQALADSTQPRREIYLLTDGQRHTFADEATRLRWELLARQLGPNPPRVTVVDFRGNRPANPPLVRLAPLTTGRAVTAIGQTVTARTALERQGPTSASTPDVRVRQEIDEKSAGDITLPASSDSQLSRPLTLRHRFGVAGSHLLGLRLDSLTPVWLPGEGDRAVAVDVLPSLPVLVIDGDPFAGGRSQGGAFVRDALAPARDPSPSARVKVVAAKQLNAAVLAEEFFGPGSAPRVVILDDVAKLTREQAGALRQFVERGGGVLAWHGPRCDAKAWTEEARQNWWPARPLEAVETVTGADDPSPAVDAMLHPALELFREAVPGGLNDAKFPKLWRLSPAGGAAVLARLTGGEAWLVEKTVKEGRVIVAAAPFDDGWRSNLVRLPAFAPLIHELTFELASARAYALNLDPGRPFRLRLGRDEPDEWTLTPPVGAAQKVTAVDGTLTIADTSEPGVYRLDAVARRRYFVVRSDPREGDLTPSSADDRTKLAAAWPALAKALTPDEAKSSAEPSGELELGWLMLLGVVVLLAVETALTRSRAAATIID